MSLGMKVEISFFDRLIHKLSKLSKYLSDKPNLAKLEKIPKEMYFKLGAISLLEAFHHVAKTHAYYKSILKGRGINPSSIQSISDFYRKVPVLKKTDIFPKFKAHEIAQAGKIDDIVSAIVTSGNSGVFAYGLITEEDVEFQKIMIDSLVNYFLEADKGRTLFIGALNMGVSFSSSYPVIMTSVRSDMVIEFVKKFSPYFDRIIVVTDPNLAKKIIDEGMESGIDWGVINIHFILGAVWPSSSMLSYMHKQIVSKNISFDNKIICNMGMTEIGLTLYIAPDELVKIREFIQRKPEIMSELFGEGEVVCPEIMYYFPTQIHVEILNEDGNGFGDIVLSTLDKKMKTMIIRYNTGDCGKFIERDKLQKILHMHGFKDKLKLTLPLIAIVGRKSDHVTGLSTDLVKEALYRDHDVAGSITGHFKILEEGRLVKVQMKKGVEEIKLIKEKIQAKIQELRQAEIRVECIKYQNFPYDMELNYENKWKHL